MRKAIFTFLCLLLVAMVALVPSDSISAQGWGDEAELDILTTDDEDLLRKDIMKELKAARRLTDNDDIRDKIWAIREMVAELPNVQKKGDEDFTLDYKRAIAARIDSLIGDVAATGAAGGGGMVPYMRQEHADYLPTPVVLPLPQELGRIYAKVMRLIELETKPGDRLPTPEIWEAGEPPPEPVEYLVYSAKFLCGPVWDKWAGVQPGSYSTAINVHNPHDQDVYGCVKAVIANPAGQPEGPISELVCGVMGPNAATEIDCPAIRHLLATWYPAYKPGEETEGTRQTDTGRQAYTMYMEQVEFIKGFVVIYAEAPLDVVGVYSAKTEAGFSLDVEHICPPCGLRTSIPPPPTPEMVPYMFKPDAGQTPPPAACTHYVSPSGSDSDPGTQQSPWQTVQYTADSVSPGDTVCIQAGTYAEDMKFNNSGKAGKPITFVGESAQKVTIKSLVFPKGAAYLNLANVTVKDFPIWGVELSGTNEHITLSGLTVVGGETGVRMTWGDSGGKPEDGAVSNITLENSRIEGPQFTCVDCTPGPCNNMTFRNLELTGAGLTGGASYAADGLAVETGKHILVEDCYIHDNSGDGIDLNSRDTQGNVPGIVVRRNIVAHNHQNGIKLWAGGRMENNIVWGQSNGPVWLATYPCTCEVVNNTIAYNMWDTSSAATRDWAFVAAYPEQEVKGVSSKVKLTLLNNIFAFNATPWPDGPTGLYLGEGVTLVEEGHNLYWSKVDDEIDARFVSGDPEFSRKEITDGTWAKATGQGTGDITKDPLFVAGWSVGGSLSTNLDLHPQPSSPAIDAGTSTKAPSTDLEDNKRPKGKAYDIGAYEHTKGIPTTKPGCPSGCECLEQAKAKQFPFTEVWCGGKQTACGANGLCVKKPVDCPEPPCRAMEWPEAEYKWKQQGYTPCQGKVWWLCGRGYEDWDVAFWCMEPPPGGPKGSACPPECECMTPTEAENAMQTLGYTGCRGASRWTCGTDPKTGSTLYCLQPPTDKKPTPKLVAGDPLEQALFDEVNARRAKPSTCGSPGTSPMATLKRNASLDKLARDHSAYMAAAGTVSHDGWNPGRFQKALSIVGGWTAAENVLMYPESYSASQMVDGWCASPGHQVNMLNPAFSKTGMGIATSGGYVYATQIFTD